MLTSRFCAGRSVTSRPSSRILPVVGVSKPPIIRSSVDFPQPDGPSSVRNAPPSTVIST